ncbi:MAG TPA: dihydrofolate reductase family protein [Thermoanaerobaculia bacterium]|nr:dihydrofolate reductase family protein [Thermoanaerobaculia bacterium]
MRRFIAYYAASADGYISRSDGSVDWLERPTPKDFYGIANFLASIDAVVMGRKTYDFAMAHGGVPTTNGAKNYLFSTTVKDVAENVELVTEDVATFVDRIRSAEGENIWLLGGAALWDSFLDAGALDELMIFVIPILIGEGIPALNAKLRTQQLELVESKPFEDGVVMLHYRIKQK